VIATFLMYFLTAAGVACLAHRRVVRISRSARVALVLLPLCFTGRALFTGGVYAPIELPYRWEPLRSMREALGVPPPHNGLLSDVYCLNMPWKYATRLAWSHGNWPLWNPFNFAGDILAASAQPTPYEPMTLLSLLLPAANSLTFLAAMTFFLAALCMFVFLRDLECSEVASLIGAAGWAFSSFLVIWLGWVIGPSTLWLPLVLLGVRRVVRRHSAAVLVVAFTMMLLNGHPESAVHIVAIGMVWAAFELFGKCRAGSQPAQLSVDDGPAESRPYIALRAIVPGLGAGILALGLCAIYLFPIIDAIPQTMEGNFRRAVWVHMKRSMPREAVLGHLESQVIPFRFGDPSRRVVAWPKSPPYNYTEAAYAGSVLLPLALLGLWRSKRPEKLVVLAIGIVGLLIGIEAAPFANWIAKLPLFDLSLNARLIFAVSFMVATLAALGIDEVATHPRDFVIVSGATTIALAALVAMEWQAMLAWGLEPEFLRAQSALLLVPLVLLTITPRKYAPAAILLLLLAQRTAEAARFYPTLPARIFYPRIAVLDRLPKGGAPYRITALGHVFVPNIATMYEVEDVRGYQAMTLERMRVAQDFFSVAQPVWFNRVDDLTRPFLSALNVRFALAPAGTPAPEGWRHVDAQPGVEVFENLRVLPRAWLPRRVIVFDGPLFGELAAETDFAQRGWVEVPRSQHMEEENASGTVSIRPRGYNAFRIDATLDRDGWLFISQSAWKGWRATIDGKPANVRKADATLLAVRVPGGRHRIELRYLPKAFVSGAWVSGITALLLALWWIRQSRRHNAPPPAPAG
jgi:hypothetical protein